MTESKPWYQSVTIWGAIIAGASALAQIGGLTVSEEEQSQLAVLLTHAGEGFGLGLVIWGRFRASRRVTVGGGTGIAVVLALASTLAASCTTLHAPSPAEQLLTACDAYQRTLLTLAGWRAAGRLSPSQIDTVDHWRPLLNATCAAPPSDNSAAGAVLAQVERGSLALLGIQTSVEEAAR